MSLDGARRMPSFGKLGSSEWDEIKKLINEGEILMRSKERGPENSKFYKRPLLLLRT